MNCKKCKKELKKEDNIFMGYCEDCFYKEYKVSNKNYTENYSSNQPNSYIGVTILCFLIPFLGFIGYVTHIKSDFSLAKKCLNSGLVSILVYIFLLSISGM